MNKKTTVLFCKEANAGARMNIQNTAGGPNHVNIQSVEIYTIHGVEQLTEGLRKDIDVKLASLNKSAKDSIENLKGNYGVIYQKLNSLAEELVQKALEDVLGDFRKRIEDIESRVAELHGEK